MATMTVPSERTFRRVLAHWSSVLKIRKIGQHSRCTFCAENSERLANTSDPAEKLEIIAARERHLQSMMADRDLEIV